jgi:hypothetical protein
MTGLVEKVHGLPAVAGFDEPQDRQQQQPDTQSRQGQQVKQPKVSGEIHTIRKVKGRRPPGRSGPACQPAPGPVERGWSWP